MAVCKDACVLLLTRFLVVCFAVAAFKVYSHEPSVQFHATAPGFLSFALGFYGFINTVEVAGVIFSMVKGLRPVFSDVGARGAILCVDFVWGVITLGTASATVAVADIARWGGMIDQVVVRQLFKYGWLGVASGLCGVATAFYGVAPTVGPPPQQQQQQQ